MNDLMVEHSGALTISDSDRIRISAAWEALSANSRRNYQGAWTRCRQWLNDRGMTTDDLSDELMAVYVASLDAEGKTPATITVAVAAVKWFSSLSEVKIDTGRQPKTNCGRFVVIPRRSDQGRLRR